MKRLAYWEQLLACFLKGLHNASVELCVQGWRAYQCAKASLSMFPWSSRGKVRL
jgi:hypothetical protein